MRKLEFALAIVVVATGLVAHAQPAAPDVSKTAYPEPVGSLARELGATPAQAEGAAGALFGAARQNMPAADWSKVSAAVPGMEALLRPLRPWTPPAPGAPPPRPERWDRPAAAWVAPPPRSRSSA